MSSHWVLGASTPSTPTASTAAATPTATATATATAASLSSSSSSSSTSLPVASATTTKAELPTEPPLLAALVHELGPRRAAIAGKHHVATAWRSHTVQTARNKVVSLHAQRTDAAAAERAAQKTLPEARQRLAHARDQLAAATERHAVRTTILRHASDQAAVNEAVTRLPFVPHEPDPNAPDPPQPTSNVLDPRTLVQERDDLSLHILRLHAQRDKLEQERAEIHRNNIQLRADLAEQVAQLPAAPTRTTRARVVPGFGSTEMRTHDSVELSAALSDTRDKLSIVRGVLQGLILESGLDWVADPRLADLMVHLQDPRAVGSDTDDSEEDESDVERESDDGSIGSANAFDSDRDEAQVATHEPDTTNVAPGAGDETGASASASASAARVADITQVTLDDTSGY